MAQVLNLPPQPPPKAIAVVSFSTPPTRSSSLLLYSPTLRTTLSSSSQSWDSLRQKLICNGGRFTCLFSDNRKQEQARKALEGALSGKKKEFVNWDKEIKKREEAGGGEGGGGRGGWLRWFGGSGGDHFWQEAQQASLAILGIILVYLIAAKGEVMLAVIFNPLLFALRGTRNGFTCLASRILQKVAPTAYSRFENSIPGDKIYTHNSAKETVVKKWASD